MMNRHLLASRFALAFSVALLLSSLGSFSAGAQNVSKTSQLDSTVTVSPNGDVQVSYSAPVFDFGAPVKISEAEKRAQAAANEAEIARFKKELQKNAVPRVTRNAAPRKAAAGATSYAVGEIPLQEGVSPSGGKMYQIPIATAPGFNLTPSISICYNSQTAGGWVGYGWDISGFSSITLINKNKYYHGENKAAGQKNTDAVFALDGNPLVRNTQSSTQSVYPLITATGNILVKPTYNKFDCVTSFTVKYPDGSTAVFKGDSDYNSYNAIVYPIAQLTDAYGNKITFHYPNYNFQGSPDRLDAVRYGYDASGQYKGEITFTYTRGSDLAGARNISRHYAGRIIGNEDRLSSIVSKSDGEVLCEYTFSYEEADRVSLLTRVDCSTDGESLPPLQFEYGATEEEGGSTTPYLYQGAQSVLTSAFSNTNSSVDFYYKRGKFVSGSYNDGLIIYPKYENYNIIDGHRPFLGKWKYLFGSPYPADQPILFAPSLTDFINQTSTSITTGEGFQTIDAVDVDGDGIDELVKVNFNGTVSGYTKLLFTVYECNASGAPIQSSQFVVHVQGTLTSGDYVSPYRREYYWGDFLGNGKVQLLTVAYNNNGMEDFSQTSYATVIDISTRTKLCESKLFDFSLEHFKYLFVCDMDNDSQTELCFTTDNGVDIYRLQTSNSFAKVRTVSGINPIFWNYNDRPYFVTDLEGDGYIDILCAPDPTVSSSSGLYNRWEVRAFNGEQFENHEERICPYRSYNECIFVDVNQDGCADLVRAFGTTLETYINDRANHSWIAQQSSSTTSTTKGIIPTNTASPLGESCFIKVDGFYATTYQYSAPSPQLRQLKKSTDSHGRTSVNTYAYLPAKVRGTFGVGWWDNSLSVNNASGFIFKTLPIYVLEREESFLSGIASQKYKSVSYAYFNSVIHKQGLGFCGFSKIRSSDAIKNILAEEIRNPEKRGATTSVKMHLGSYGATPFFTVTNTYDNNSTTYGKLNPRLTKSVTSSALTNATTTTTYTYGKYDLPTKIVTSRRIGSGTPQTETLTRTYQHTVNTIKYILGMVTEEAIVKEGDGAPTISWKEKSVNTYDGNGHLLSTKHYVGPYGTRPILDDQDDQDEHIERSWPLDRFEPFERAELPSSFAKTRVVEQPHIPYEPFDPGDPDDPVDPGDPEDPVDPGDPVDPEDPITLTENVDATNLVSETRWQYDSFGNVILKRVYPYGASLPLSNTYTYDSDGRYLLTETDALGHTTTYGGHNKFGKPITVTDYRNRTTTYVYNAWGAAIKKTCPDGTVEQTTPAWGGIGLYTVTNNSSGSPETITHYDALGREIRTGQKRFDDQWQYVDKVYDSKGRLQKTSLPYRGTSAVYWSTCNYDAYDRPTSITEASGKVTTWSYNGASTTTVKDGISSTSTVDASGNVIRVVDAGGTITYTLRDDGQPESITAPGNVTTTFTYDDYGRKTQIVDPSAGTQTDSYVWNSDGSSVLTHVNPNGTIKTYVDKYGRTTKIERPGEYTTTYTYNSYGQLTKEQSTNGTSTEYTYDSNSRVSTSKETVPDGKWLKKTYTYTSGSILSKVAYESQSGVITTETYTYANGHNTKITLANGTVVWNLTAENDLGLPTAGTTGSVTREYGYTAFGMPTYRRMAGGALQDMRYQFDPLKGNLSSRRDETRGLSETFDYDDLNRLTYIGNRQISYDNKGNILSMGGVGTMSYGSSAHPYQITSLTTASNSVVANRAQSVTYTCYSRPSVLTEGGRSAAFTYNGDGDRVKMYVANGSTQVLTRYYIGGKYEFDQTPSGTKERLYLGGDAYSAPMVYQREGSGSWAAYNIGRDYLGNITHIATASGTLVAEYSYDPWGRLRNPSTLAIYTPGNEPELFLGRGFTGHEHLTWFGLINMNARLYDPTLGRFLSPDPYIQSPDLTQNFNRYSYALNNPLKYTDESGEEAWYIELGAALLGGAVNWIDNGCKFSWEGLCYFGVGAAAGLACLHATKYINEILGLQSSLNSFIRQGFGGDNEWNWKDINAGQLVVSYAEGYYTAKWGGALSEWISGFISPAISNLLPGKAWSGLVEQSITSGAVGLVMGGTVAAMKEYSATGYVTWDNVWAAAKTSGLNGLATGSLKGFVEGILNSKPGENPFALKKPKEDLPTAKSLGLQNETERIKTDLKYEDPVDGGVFGNGENKSTGKSPLPQKDGVTYKEYLVAPKGWTVGSHPGSERIVVGSDGIWYYTPDLYKTVKKFKP